MWVAVDARGRAVGGPSGVCNTGVRVEDLGEIWLLLCNELLQLHDLANLLEGEDLVLLVAIDRQTCGIITTVLEPGKAIDEGVENELPVLLHQVVDVSENTTVGKGKSAVGFRGGRRCDPRLTLYVPHCCSGNVNRGERRTGRAWMIKVVPCGSVCEEKGEMFWTVGDGMESLEVGRDAGVLVWISRAAWCWRDRPRLQ